MYKAETIAGGKPSHVDFIVFYILIIFINLKCIVHFMYLMEGYLVSMARFTSDLKCIPTPEIVIITFLYGYMFYIFPSLKSLTSIMRPLTSCHCTE